MKRLQTAGLSLTASALLFSAPAAADSVPGTYQVDAAHSKVGFEVPHLVISTVEGRFNAFKGEIQLDKEFAKSSVQAEVEVASIDTGVPQRDEHLRSPDFFEVAKHPMMTFKSKRIEGAAPAFRLVGDLTIKGITREVALATKLLGSVVDAYGNQKIALDASTRINRRDFGLTWGKMVEAGPVVGDTVTLILKIQGSKPGPKTGK